MTCLQYAAAIGAVAGTVTVNYDCPGVAVAAVTRPRGGRVQFVMIDGREFAQVPATDAAILVPVIAVIGVPVRAALGAVDTGPRVVEHGGILHHPVDARRGVAAAHICATV